MKQDLEKLKAAVAALPPDRRTALMETLTGNAERQRHYVERQRALGRVKATWWLDEDLVEAVHRLASQFEGDKATRINAVLRHALLEK